MWVGVRVLAQKCVFLGVCVFVKEPETEKYVTILLWVSGSGDGSVLQEVNTADRR